VFHPLPADNPMQRQPDIPLARQRLGWGPTVQPKEALCYTIAYFGKLLSGSQ
jgi:UDP-glucuronate decarboxylase